MTMEERIQDAIEAIGFAKDGHVEWKAHLIENPEYSTKDVGDVNHHTKSIKKYEEILELLKEIKDAQAANPNIPPLLRTSKREEGS